MLPRMLRRLLSLALAAALASPLAAADDATFQRELAAWRAERVARLTAPEGWLSLVGLHWLEPGDNSVGTAEDNTIRLSAGPAYVGSVHLAPDGKVTFVAAPGSLASADGAPVAGSKSGAVELSYGGGKPTTVTAHNLSFFVVQRSEKIGLRVRDSQSDRRRNFAGIDYFDADPSWRIEAQWVAFDEPRMIPITNMLGQTSPSPVPGKAVFTRDGKSFELLPISDGGDGRLFFIISDATSGGETYEAARFLYADAPKDGKVILDFNRAQNPPCAFTPFATCPLPPKENRLPIRIAAGEKNYRGEHP